LLPFLERFPGKTGLAPHRDEAEMMEAVDTITRLNLDYSLSELVDSSVMASNA